MEPKSREPGWAPLEGNIDRSNRLWADGRVGRDAVTWVAAWGGVVAAGFLNGGLHRGYAPALGEPVATRVSELVLPMLVAPWVLFVEHRRPLPTLTAAAAAGACWAMGTVSFEFLFGHYVSGKSWAALRAAYNPAAGRIWVFDVAAIGAAPVLARAWRRRGLSAAS